MRNLLLSATAAALLAGCGQSTNDSSNQAAANAAAPAKKKIPYCFFENSEMKGWAARRGKDGNIIVKGKVYRDDSRYQAILDPATVSGTQAEVSPNLRQNPGPYGAENNWWDVSQTIANRAAVEKVDVTCGGKTVAELKINPKG